MSNQRILRHGVVTSPGLESNHFHVSHAIAFQDSRVLELHYFVKVWFIAPTVQLILVIVCGRAQLIYVQVNVQPRSTSLRLEDKTIALMLHVRENFNCNPMHCAVNVLNLTRLEPWLRLCVS